MFTEEEKKAYKKEIEAFFEKYPDCPRSKPVECLNLIMKKEFAEQILSGEKKVEFRAYSKHYCDRLYETAVVDWSDKKAAEIEDEEARGAFLDEVLDYASPLRPVKKIHFHNYSNSWYLDVECIANYTTIIERTDVEFLQDEFGCHELDEELERLEKMKAKDRPILFYFAIGKVLDTNLK